MLRGSSGKRNQSLAPARYACYGDACYCQNAIAEETAFSPMAHITFRHLWPGPVIPSSQGVSLGFGEATVQSSTATKQSR